MFADGKEIATAHALQRVTAALPPKPANEPRMQPTAGWKKFEGNPVMGGKYGTCFDIAVFKEEAMYRMWLLWRPKKSLAIVESCNLQEWTRIGAMNLGKARRAPQQRAADVSSAEPSFFCRQDAGSTLRFIEVHRVA